MNQNSKQKEWYIFYCSSRAEKKAAETLRKYGFEVFLPLVTQMRKWSDRNKKVSIPMFPSYLFVRCKVHEISKVLQFQHIVAPLKMEGIFAYLRQKDVDNINQLLELGYYVEALPGKVEIGDDVIVEKGPFKGQEGKCISESGENYICIQIPSITHYLKVRLPLAIVRKKEETKSTSKAV